MNPGGYPEFCTFVITCFYPEAFPIALPSKWKRSKLFDLVSQSIPELTIRDWQTGKYAQNITKVNPNWFITSNPEWSNYVGISEDQNGSVQRINELLQLGGFKKDPSKIIVLAS